MSRVGKLAQAGNVVRLQTATWEQIISFYLDECRFRRMSAKTIKDKEWWLERFTDSDCPPADALTSTHVIDFVGKYKNGATAHKAFTVIAAFCKWLTREGWIESNPCTGLSGPKVPKVIIPTFETTEVEAMIQSAEKRGGFIGTRDAAIIVLLYDTGMRVSELCGLADSDMDINAKRLLVHGKGDKERTVFFGLHAKRLLNNYLVVRNNALSHEETAPCRLFISAEVSAGGSTIPLTANYVSKMVRRYAKLTKAKCRRPSPHTLRHTFAVQFLRGGGSVFALQRLLGHETLEMTRRYVQLADTDLETAHAIASPGDRLNKGADGQRKRLK